MLTDDVEALKERGVPFDWDYRKAWHAITGEKADGLPPPEGVVRPPTNPIELEDRYLAGLGFPASKGAVLGQARRNSAPARVMQVLERLNKTRFNDLPDLLESVGDLTWDHD